MDTMRAFAMGMANRGRPCRVFDWHKAAGLIRDRKPERADAGLAEDADWTVGEIFNGGLPTAERDGAWLASTWATPTLYLDGEAIECWLMMDDSPGWDANTHWPESARELLGATP